MTMTSKSVTESGRIFQSPVLEALTKTHIAIPLTMFYGLGLFMIGWSVLELHFDLMGTVATFLAGLFFFSLVEYAVHRYFYHMGTGSPRKARMQYMFHGVHHEHPRDKKRLALPPIMSVVLASAFIGLFRLTMGMHGFAFGGGFLTGYATYLLAHYAIHIYHPPKNILRIIWKHHNLHHFVGDSGAFGVSTPFWDHIFGTMPVDPRAKKVAHA